MQITSSIESNGQGNTIRIAGCVNPNNACGILQLAIVEAYSQSHQELTLDLRQASFETSDQMFRLHSLLQLFKQVILKKGLRIMVLLPSDAGGQWFSLGKAEDFDGINLRSYAYPVGTSLATSGKRAYSAATH